ncbi:substrate-binding domain-containing protein [Cohnella sp. CFH 77786]|uniref:LacI family DNA-binding transcriptional regulator n=1 Tax=Cohnella sp. CFH 77786 TaxID=2662265 RepID=UPI001C60E7CC|nr:LacI family DNA-binding transcriptional regulator [Cohnella sp. CFH 77786]MBW5447782.1 substrate-binding domain-containing protein [Cohnella sp. CFH 77786]
MKATIYDIAKEAGVSITTVSQVINGKGKISEERRKEIFRIMERLHYQPSVIAAALTGKKTYTLGLIVPDISNPFFAEMARAVEDQGHRSGYSLMICSTDNKDDRVQSYLTLMRKKRVDGIIIGTGMDDERMLNPLVEAGIPIVLIAREMPSQAVHTVIVDDGVGGGLVARHLLEQGHRRMAILAEHPKVSSSRNRIIGFKQAVDEAGMILENNGIRYCDYTVEDGKRKALELLGEAVRPTALFCCNDLLAIGALQAAKELDIRVPDQLSVVGFDNTILASVTDPPLTTVAQPIERMGKIAVDLLMQELTDPSVIKQRIVLRPDLVVRHSASSSRPDF